MKVQLLTATAKAPTRGTAGSAGLDLYADLRNPDTTQVVPEHGTVVVKCGIAVALPLGYVALVAPRSGLAYNEGLTILNGPGVLDEDFRGEVTVLLHNASQQVRFVKHGQRVGQLVLVRYWSEQIEVVSELDATVRGTKGYGSTGK